MANLDGSVNLTDFTIPGATDWTQSFLNAVNASLCVRVPLGTFNLNFPTPYALPSGLTLIGVVNGRSKVAGGSSVLNVTGGASSCFTNLSGSSFHQNTFKDLVINHYGSQKWLFDVGGMLNVTFDGCYISTSSLITGILRTTKIGTNPSWNNVLHDSSFIVPIGAGSNVFDVDFTDTMVDKCVFGGGVGSIARGVGFTLTNNRFSNASVSALYCWSSPSDARMSWTIVSNEFDANINNLTLEVNPQTSGMVTTNLMTTILGNHFRSTLLSGMPASTTLTDINLINTSGTQYYGPMIGLNHFSSFSQNLTNIQYDPTLFSPILRGNLSVKGPIPDIN